MKIQGGSTLKKVGKLSLFFFFPLLSTQCFLILYRQTLSIQPKASYTNAININKFLGYSISLLCIIFESTFQPYFSLWKSIYLNAFQNKPWFLCVCTIRLLKTVGKGEIACNQQFLSFPQCFSTHLENFLPFSTNSKLLSANSLSLEQSKICHLEKG